MNPHILRTRRKSLATRNAGATLHRVAVLRIRAKCNATQHHPLGVLQCCTVRGCCDAEPAGNRAFISKPNPWPDLLHASRAMQARDIAAHVADTIRTPEKGENWTNFTPHRPRAGA
ncbi:Hypothetical protein BN117_2232 [Bordetella parapertussis Bpp5]|uniref:Uncharacterized protein n=1 Tax=Bordetella parapertussis (strain Bpp5) TaxID=1208660 RepID=K0MI88_BORPB|nr:Hypothetical protein BN117_2232 [Bordetella parapertussis Bpp5]